MGRITRNYMLPIGAAILVVGLALSLLAYWDMWSARPSWYESFLDAIPGQGLNGDWNVFLRILGPVLVVTGAWYAGEQLVLRRRFDRMIDTTKKSEFVARRKDLEDLSRRLPTTYRSRIEEKEAAFRSMR